ncbi:MAG: MGMT family protein [Saprospiraceae bacterium]|nr:MGMT family protein [Saprospiraceae bacterium]
MRHYQEEVYDLVKSIPKGRVSTYGAISNFLSLGSARMVGWALNQLKGSHGIPAHRVVNSKGELSGSLYFGVDPGMKGLLEKEKIEIKDNKIVNFKEKFWDPSIEIQ